jgi:hypothetical protein
MGWLFGHKKVQPKVPFPEGRLAEGSLTLPGKLSRERIIEPDEVKAAAGLEKPIAFPRSENPFSFKKTRDVPLSVMPPSSVPTPNGPLFLKLDTYQQVLTELNNIKAAITTVNITVSRYNEEEEFLKLRKSVKSLHDKLISIDKALFKAGDGN